MRCLWDEFQRYLNIRFLLASIFFLVFAHLLLLRLVPSCSLEVWMSYIVWHSIHIYIDKVTILIDTRMQDYLTLWTNNLSKTLSLPSGRSKKVSVLIGIYKLFQVFDEMSEWTFGLDFYCLYVLALLMICVIHCHF